MFYFVKNSFNVFVGSVVSEWDVAYDIAEGHLSESHCKQVYICECNQDGERPNANYQTYTITRETVAKERRRQEDAILAQQEAEYKSEANQAYLRATIPGWGIPGDTGR